MHAFDTHLHIDDPTTAENLFDQARTAGVDSFLVAGGDLTTSQQAAALARSHVGVYAAAGVHPHEAEHFRERAPFRELYRQERVVAVGEIGLDYYYDHSPRDRQREVFKTFLNVASETGIPPIVHCRDAFEDCFAILEDWIDSGRVFEIHSFTGSPEQAEKALQMGAFLSFNGMVTFKKAQNIRDTLAVVPLDRLLLETDSPYLAPVPHRGKRNCPAYVIDIVNAVAELKGIPPEEMARITTANAYRFFQIDPASNDGPRVKNV